MKPSETGGVVEAARQSAPRRDIPQGENPARYREAVHDGRAKTIMITYKPLWIQQVLLRHVALQ